MSVCGSPLYCAKATPAQIGAFLALLTLQPHVGQSTLIGLTDDSGLLRWHSHALLPKPGLVCRLDKCTPSIAWSLDLLQPGREAGLTNIRVLICMPDTLFRFMPWPTSCAATRWQWRPSSHHHLRIIFSRRRRIVCPPARCALILAPALCFLLHALCLLSAFVFRYFFLCVTLQGSLLGFFLSALVFL